MPRNRLRKVARPPPARYEGAHWARGARGPGFPRRRKVLSAVSTHERIERHEEVVGSSNRAFGFVFAGVFTVLTLLKLWRGWSDLGFLWLALAAGFAAVAIAAPRLLAPLNRVWLRFGLLLHRVVNPIVMGLLFFAVVTPIGLAMRAAGKEILRLRREAGAKTYWIERNPPGPAPDTMKNQF